MRALAVAARSLHRERRLAGAAAVAHSVRARFAARRGRWFEAAQHWGLAIGCAAQVSPAWYARYVGSADRAGDPKLQMGALRAAVTGDPTDVAAWRRLATLTAETGGFEAAAHVHREMVALLPKPPVGSFLYLVRGYRRRGLLGEAQSLAELALQHHPHRVRPVVEAARAAEARGALQVAEDHWSRALVLAPDDTDPRWHAARAAVLDGLGRPDDAAASYGRAIAAAADVDHPWAHNLLPEWRFQVERLTASDQVREDPRWGVRLEPVPTGDLAATDGEAGVYWVELQRRGLLLRGYLDAPPPEEARVSVRVDGRAVKAVGLNGRVRPSFRLLLRHQFLRHLSGRSTLTVTSGEAPLRYRGGGSVVELHVPHGQGVLVDRLAGGWVVTKKGHLQRLTTIGRDTSTTLLDAYERARELFAAVLGVDLFLLYGSLLGCHRDGTFIPGDDDVDVGYVTDATSGASLKEIVVPQMQSLMHAGHHVQVQRGGALFKVDVDGVLLDVYPLWFADGRAYGYDGVPADREHYLPARTAQVDGREVLVPNDAETILAGSYGQGWQTPDPGFKHVRSRALRKQLDTACLTPSEVEELRSHNQRAREDAGSEIGRFRPQP